MGWVGGDGSCGVGWGGVVVVVECVTRMRV